MMAAITSPSPSQMAHQSSFCQSSLHPGASADPVWTLAALEPWRVVCCGAIPSFLFAGMTISEENPPSQWERSNPKLPNVLARNESLENWMPCFGDNGGAVT